MIKRKGTSHFQQASVHFEPSSVLDRVQLRIRFHLEGGYTFELRVFRNKIELHEHSNAKDTYGWVQRAFVVVSPFGKIVFVKDASIFSFRADDRDGTVCTGEYDSRQDLVVVGGVVILNGRSGEHIIREWDETWTI